MATKRKFRLTVDFYLDIQRPEMAVQSQVTTLARSEIENSLQGAFDEEVNVEGIGVKEVPA